MSDMIRAADFEGRVIPLLARGGEEWATTDVVASMLGYKDPRKVVRLFRSHSVEFTAREVAEVTLDGHGSVPNSGPKRKLIFSLRGVELLAIFSRTDLGRRVRKWCVDRLEAERNGSRVVSADQLARLVERQRLLEKALEEARAQHVADLKRVTEGLLASNAVMASALGTAMAHRRHQKAKERALEAELKIGQQFFPRFSPGDSTSLAAPGSN